MLIVLTPFWWMATVLVLESHDSSVGAEAGVAILLAVTYPVAAALCFTRRVPTFVALVVTLALLLSTGALAASVWSDRRHYAGASPTASWSSTDQCTVAPNWPRPGGGTAGHTCSVGRV